MNKNETFLDFGLVIAYILPGCIMLLGSTFISPSINSWLLGAINSATFGGFLFVILAAIGAGLLSSTIRWLLIDNFHHWSGIEPPPWDFSSLGERTEAYQLLIEIHYRYYQFYSNTLIAIFIAYLFWRLESTWGVYPFGWPEVAAVFLELLFWAASRDTLRQYYKRAGALLGNAKHK